MQCRSAKLGVSKLSKDAHVSGLHSEFCWLTANTMSVGWIHGRNHGHVLADRPQPIKSSSRSDRAISRCNQLTRIISNGLIFAVSENRSVDLHLFQSSRGDSMANHDRPSKSEIYGRLKLTPKKWPSLWSEILCFVQMCSRACKPKWEDHGFRLGILLLSLASMLESPLQ